MRFPLERRFTSALLGLVLVAAAARGTTVKLAQGATLDLGDGDPVDLSGVTCNCPAATIVRHLGGSTHALIAATWEAITVLDAEAAGGSSFDFIPQGNEVYAVRTSSNRYVKLRFAPGGTNTASGIDLEYEPLLLLFRHGFETGTTGWSGVAP